MDKHPPMVPMLRTSQGARGSEANVNCTSDQFHDNSEKSEKVNASSIDRNRCKSQHVLYRRVAEVERCLGARTLRSNHGCRRLGEITLAPSLRCHALALPRRSTLSVEPRNMKSHTDTAEPKRPTPSTEEAEPSRAKERSDREDPRCMKSRTLMELPAREKDLNKHVERVPDQNILKYTEKCLRQKVFSDACCILGTCKIMSSSIYI